MNVYYTLLDNGERIMNKTRRRRRIRKTTDDIYVDQFAARVQANKLVSEGSTVAYPRGRLLRDLWKEVVPARHRLGSAYLKFDFFLMEI